MKPRFAFNLGSDVLEALDGLRTATRDWPTVLGHLSAFLEGGATNADTRRIESALDAAGLGDEIARVREFWDQVDDRIKLLLDPIDDLESQIVWPIFVRDVDVVRVPLLMGSASFNASLQTSAQIERLDAEEFSEMGITLLPELAMLRIGVEGGLNVEMSGAASSGMLSASARVGGSARLDLDYLFSQPRRQFLIQGLANTLPHVPPPYDVTQISAAREHHLEAVTITAKGHADIGFGVSGGQVWGTQFSVDAPGASSNHTVGLATGVSASFEASLNLAGSFNVVVRPSVDGPVFVRLERATERKTATSIDVGAQVGITGLDAVGLDLTRTFLPDAEELIAELEEYLDLGRKVRELLDEQLDLDGVAESTVELLTGGGTAKELSAAILDAGEAAADASVAGLLGSGGSRADELVAGIANRLGFDASKRDLLAELLTPVVRKTLGAIETELEDAVAKWSDKGETELAKLLKPLENVGGDVQSLIGDLQGDVDAVLEPVLEFLNRYQRIRAKVVTALEGAAKVKIGVSLSHAIATGRARELLLELQIDPSKRRAAEAYALLVTGSFSRAVEVGRKGGQGVSIVGGTLREVVSNERRIDFNLSIGSLTLSSQRFLSHDFTATYDAAGNVVAVGSSTDLRKVVNGWREQREIRFVSAFELARAADTNAMLTAAVTVSHRDEKLKRKELEQWIGSLEQAGLVAPGATERALLRFDELGASADRKFFKANLAVALRMGAEEIGRLLAFDEETIKVRAVVNQLRTRFASMDEQREFIAAMQQIVLAGNWIQAVLEVGSRGALVIHGNTAGSPPRELLVAQFMGRRAIGLAEILAEIKRAAERELPMSRAEVRDMDELNRRLQKMVNQWLLIRGPIGGLVTERLKAATTAFLGLLLELTGGGSQTDYLVPVIQWNAGEPNQTDEVIV